MAGTVPTSKFWGDLLSLAAGTTGPWHTPFIGLFTNNIVPSWNSVIGGAGFVEASYTGYAEVAAVPLTAFQDSDGSYIVQFQMVSFVGPTAGGGPTVYGYFLADASTSGNVLQAEAFTTPFALTVAPLALTFSPQLKFSSGQTWGAATVVSY
jgi:hypothetical protein